MFIHFKISYENNNTDAHSHQFTIYNETVRSIEKIINQYHGAIDKFMRDGVLSLFNYPNVMAVKAALEISSFFNREALKKDISVDIALHGGDVMFGMVGEANRLEGTVIGDTVNLCARLLNYNETYKSPVLISESLKQHVDLDQANITARYLDEVTPKGITTPVRIYAVQTG